MKYIQIDEDDTIINILESDLTIESENVFSVDLINADALGKKWDKKALAVVEENEGEA